MQRMFKHGDIRTTSLFRDKELNILIYKTLSHVVICSGYPVGSHLEFQWIRDSSLQSVLHDARNAEKLRLSCFFHHIALHFISCLVLYCIVLFCCTVHYCLFSFLIFSLLATSSIKLNLNLNLNSNFRDNYNYKLGVKVYILLFNSQNINITGFTFYVHPVENGLEKNLGLLMEHL